jgi:hypothetical protein
MFYGLTKVLGVTWRIAVPVRVPKFIDAWIMKPRPCHKCGKPRKPADPEHEECD